MPIQLCALSAPSTGFAFIAVVCRDTRYRIQSPVCLGLCPLCVCRVGCLLCLILLFPSVLQAVTTGNKSPHSYDVWSNSCLYSVLLLLHSLVKGCLPSGGGARIDCNGAEQPRAMRGGARSWCPGVCNHGEGTRTCMHTHR